MVCFIGICFVKHVGRPFLKTWEYGMIGWITWEELGMIIPGCVLGWEKESEKGGKNSEKSNNVYDIYIWYDR